MTTNKINAQSLLVRQQKISLEKASVLVQERVVGQMGGKKTQNRRNCEKQSRQKGITSAFSGEWKPDKDEPINNRVPKSGGRRSSGISDRNLTSRGFNTGNITVIDDRKYSSQAMTKRLSNSSEKNDPRENDIDDDDDDDDGLYFAGGKVLNENIHKYEVAQAIPETYGKATVIRHGKKQ